MNFDYEKIMRPKTAVHCPTEDQANVLLQWAHEQGLKWCTNGSYLENNHWDIGKEKTCYYLFKGKRLNKERARELDVTIYFFDNVLNKDKDKKKKRVKHFNNKSKIEDTEENFDKIINLLKTNKKFKRAVNNLVDLVEE